MFAVFLSSESPHEPVKWQRVVVVCLLVLLAMSGSGIAQEYLLPGPPLAPANQPPPTAWPPNIGSPPVATDPALGGFMNEGLPPPNEPLWSPATWIKPVDWDRSVELGINSSEGNADAFSIRAGGEMKRKTDFNEIGFDMTYSKASANQVETQHNALFNAGYEQFLGNSRWTVFDKLGLEYDEFRAFDLRFWLNAGVGYEFIKTDALSWKGRFGAGASREFGGPSDEWIPEAVFGTDYTQQLGEKQKVSAKVDYFPAWEDYSDYRVIATLGWEIVLSDEHDLSLKLSVNDRYDSTPHGRRPNDVNYSILLLWTL